MIFGGIMEVTGLLGRLSNPIVNRSKQMEIWLLAKKTCIFFNITINQYLSIVVPGEC